MTFFTELCIRFADDFNHTLDDWKPNTNDPNLMNLCLVTEGSYEVCTQTTKALKVRYYLWFRKENTYYYNIYFFKF